MHYTLVPIGSRGDVQPFVALGRRLQRAGHAVRIATHDAFAGFVTGLGLDFVSVGGDPDSLLAELTPRTMSRNPLESVPAILDLLSGLITPTLRGVAQVIADPSRPTDAVISSYPALFSGIEAADQRKVPLILASLHPVSRSRQLQSLLLPSAPGWLPSAWAGHYREWSHSIGEELIFRMVRRAVDRARRRELDWGPCPGPPVRTVHRRKLPILYPLSPTLLPPPSDWPTHARVTGFWFLEAEPSWQPPPDLADFLASGPPPIYVGFGSMGDLAAPALRAILTALSARRQRALVTLPPTLRREIDPSSLPDHILAVGALPHSWLFPRTAAVIHHGGVGTTAEALRAGVPMAIVHLSVEQAFWGRLAQQLGVAPPPISASQLAPAVIDDLLQRLAGDVDLRRSAERAGAAVRQEQGVDNAVAALSEWRL